MHRHGFDLQLTQYDERGWRATFYTTGMEHSPTSATGTGWERTPWHATQRAAWGSLRRISRIFLLVTCRLGFRGGWEPVHGVAHFNNADRVEVSRE
jgi:hypothetical protein